MILKTHGKPVRFFKTVTSIQLHFSYRMDSYSSVSVFRFFVLFRRTPDRKPNRWARRILFNT
jgi:hypothetical protein